MKNKPLYLRGCFRNDDLHFDSSGHLLDASAPTTFTLCGFDLRTLHLRNDKLILEGWRVGLELVNNQQKRVRLKVADALITKDEKMHIEIDADASRDYRASLNAIFVEGLTDMVSSLPVYWQKYAHNNFLQSEPASAAPVAGQRYPPRIGGSIAPPQQLLPAAEPKFTNSARALLYSGKNVISIWIHPDGSVSHMSIVRALGLGLDESAFAAVQNYRFKPAMQDGKPVLVEVDMEVNFQIY